MQYNLDFNIEKDSSKDNQVSFLEEANRIQEENSAKKPELYLGKFESEESYIEEKQKIADQYKTFPDRIEFRNNDWYMKDSSLTVEDWDRAQDNSDFDYKSGQKY